MSNTNSSAKRKRKPLQMILISGALLVFAGVFALSLFADRGGAAHVQPSMQVVYVKDQQLLAQTTGKKEEIFTLVERLADSSTSEEDWEYLLYDMDYYAYTLFQQAGNLVFYPQDIVTDYESDPVYELHYRDLTDEKRSGRLDKDVTAYTVSNKGDQVVYRRVNGDLFVHDLKANKRIATNVDVYFEFQADGGKLVYSSEGDLYLVDLNTDEKAMVIDEGYASLYRVNEDFSKIYYFKDEAFYLKESGQQAKKLFDQATYIEQIYEDGSMYYTYSNYTDTPYLDYVIDDRAETDQEIVEPQFEDFWVTASDEDESSYFDEEAYDDALDAYWESVYQNEIFDNLDEYTFTKWSNSLYFFDGTTSHLVTDDYDSYSYSYNKSGEQQKPIWVYYKEKTTDLTPIPLSELEDIYELEDRLYGYSDYTSDNQAYIAFGKEEQKLDATSDLYAISINPDGSSIYFLREGKNDEYELVQAEISGEKLINETVKDSGVSSYYFNGDYWNDEPIYFKNMLEDQLSEGMYWFGYNYVAGDLYIAGEKIDSFVDPNSVRVQPDGRLSYMVKFSNTTQSGTLRYYDGKETAMIANDVNRYLSLEDGAVLYLRNFNTRKQYGDLYLHVPGQTDRKLDERVNFIATIHETSKAKGGK